MVQMMRWTLALLVAMGGGLAFAQDFPNRTVRIVVPAAAGGAVDAISRISHRSSTAVVEPAGRRRKPARSGRQHRASSTSAKSAADGYTYLTVSQSFAHNISVYPNLSWHPVRDFAPVMLIGTTNGVLLVPPTLPVKSVKELIALAKARPGELSYATTGSGTSGHMYMAFFAATAGINVAHVPYRDVTQAQADLISGRVQLYIAPMPAFIALVRSGRLRALAVTGTRRSGALAEVPTMQEAGVQGYEAVTWYGFYTAAKTPREVIEKTHGELIKALQSADVRERFAALGIEIVAGTPNTWPSILEDEVAKWAKVAKTLNMRAE